MLLKVNKVNKSAGSYVNWLVYMPPIIVFSACYFNTIVWFHYKYTVGISYYANGIYMQTNDDACKTKVLRARTKSTQYKGSRTQFLSNKKPAQQDRL